MFKKIMMTLALMMASVWAGDAPAQDASKIIGTWLTQKPEKNAKIKIEACPSNPSQFCGKIVWLQKPTYADGSPKIDKNNKDENLRTRPLLNLENLIGFVESDTDSWVDGTIYNPEDGNIYSCTITLVQEDDKEYLDVHGYIGITLFGKTQRWIRATS